MLTNPILGSHGAQTGSTFVQNFIPSLIILIFIGTIIVFIFILIIGAIQWIGAGTDKQNLENAKGKVTNALVGIALLFSLYILMAIIDYFFCVNLLSLNLDSLRVTNLGGVGAAACPTLPGPTGGGGGTGGGGIGGGGGTSNGQGLAACPCFNNLGCAQAGAIALGNQPGGRTCNLCTATGWTTTNPDGTPVGNNCSGANPITCYSTCR